MTAWSIQQAKKLYNIQHWSNGYFDINKQGHVIAQPLGSQSTTKIDIPSLIKQLQDKGYSLPVLVRFHDILVSRVAALRDAFDKACLNHHYQGSYHPVYPIKVNQHRQILTTLSEQGKTGLEAGSKSELMAVMSVAQPGSMILCNGYKDREYIQLAFIAKQLGFDVFIILEKCSELDIIVDLSKQHQPQPKLGIRLRLSSVAKGKWQNTGGEKSKFGLTPQQTLATLDKLKQHQYLPQLQLIHCHLGSQIANIRDIQRAMRECARNFVELSSLGANLCYVDVGGGLGVDYDGSHSHSDCSINYSMAEYANNIVMALQEVCQQHQLKEPNIISESGRAMVAHHALLITNIIDVDQLPEHTTVQQPAPSDPPLLHDMWQDYQKLNARHAVESYHNVCHWLGEANTLYTHGILSLQQRAYVEKLYIAICQKVRALLDMDNRTHRALSDELNEKLADKLFCNLSIFQSLPDIWAIDQIFPIMPLSHLDQYPSRKARLQDITCDSDGRIDNYVEANNLEPTLSLPALDPKAPYPLGFFLVGAYQEILGDMHNLFGDTHAVSVKVHQDGQDYQILEDTTGNNVASLLEYVHFQPQQVLASYQQLLQQSNLDDKIKQQHAQFLEQALLGYSYLED